MVEEMLEVAVVAVVFLWPPLMTIRPSLVQCHQLVDNVHVPYFLVLHMLV